MQNLDLSRLPEATETARVFRRSNILRRSMDSRRTVRAAPTASHPPEDPPRLCSTRLRLSRRKIRLTRHRRRQLVDLRRFRHLLRVQSRPHCRRSHRLLLDQHHYATLARDGVKRSFSLHLRMVQPVLCLISQLHRCNRQTVCLKSPPNQAVHHSKHPKSSLR